MKRTPIIAALLMAFAIGCKPADAPTNGEPTDPNKKVSTSDKKELNLALLAPGSSDFWKVVEAGAQKGAKEFNAKVEVITPSDSSASEQKSRIESLLSQGIDGIALAPINPKDQIDIINKAAKQTKLICTDTDAAASDRLCYIGSNNVEAGRLAGEELKKALPNGGKVYACVGVEDMQNAIDRIGGIREAIKGTNIVLVGVLTDNVDNAKAKSNVENKVVATPDVAAFVGIWSYNGPQIINALKGAGKLGKIKIVCFDEDPVTLQGVKDSYIFSTIVQNPYNFGYESVRVLSALARGEDAKIPANKIIDTGLTVVNKKNVVSFEKEFNERLGKK